MPLSTEAADLRARLRKQLKRLRARPQEEGPLVAYRDGKLLVAGKATYVVTPEMIAELECLRAGAGSVAVWKVIELIAEK
jgi:hypothetical protein